MKATVDIGVPCSKSQSPSWWGRVLGDALRHQNMGITFGNICLSKGAMTDTNRNKIAKAFRAGGSEWLYFIDDDTVHPWGALYRMLDLAISGGHRVVSGVYFGRVDVKAGQLPVPLLYQRRPDGTYDPVTYYKGEILTLDATGLGCSLIHRSVFDDFMRCHVVMRRHTGPFYPVPHEAVAAHEAIGSTVVDVLSIEGDPTYPFFVMDNGRTEDMFFFEGTARFGVRPVVDTRIECRHLDEYAIDGEDYWSMVNPWEKAAA